MIRTVVYKGWTAFNRALNLMVLRKVEREGIVQVAFPFLEDTPNFDLTIAEAMDLRDALNDLIGEVLALPAPAAELFPPTQVSVSDQSAFSGLFDRFSTNSEKDRGARIALRMAADILGLPIAWSPEDNVR
ncbi:hypothetical protein [Paenibacillus sp. UASWS1643]|uniref:hypothetical protein n=1 Tax=Paenibacillus sp. UASWS1643 TaxID=2580422 RepID=UPI001239A6CA|nr:hypothetical protein [Paenibacillus sp. UASWS1643]KAA8750064.1 hypothetical protein FE296_15815 [Paenibacillus sp. UASWS1643]